MLSEYNIDVFLLLFVLSLYVSQRSLWEIEILIIILSSCACVYVCAHAQTYANIYVSMYDYRCLRRCHTCIHATVPVVLFSLSYFLLNSLLIMYNHCKVCFIAVVDIICLVLLIPPILVDIAIYLLYFTHTQICIRIRTHTHILFLSFTHIHTLFHPQFIYFPI